MKNVMIAEKTREIAITISSECMGMEDSFCKSRCPMSTDVKGYVNSIAEGDFDKAISIIREKLFLPNTLGHICAHPCEMECRRNREFNQPISIAGLKRFAAEQADDESKWDVTVAEATGKKVAVIGSGPAGAQAAIDLRKAGHEVTVFEKNEKPGGMLRYGIPAYRLPKDILDREYKYLTMLGIEVKCGCDIGKDITFAQLKEDYDAVVIAVGAQKGSIIKMPGSDSADVFSATEFLKEISITGGFDKAKSRVMVIGGGDVAMDCIRSAIRLPQVTEVYQCSLEAEDILPASAEEKEESLAEGMKANFGYGPMEILTENGNVYGIRIKKVNSIFDENGNFNPSYLEDEKVIAVDTVVMATGQMVEDVTAGGIEQIRGGRYKVDADTMQTSEAKVFVAGDAAGGHIVVEAMALGRKTAISVNRFLAEQDLLENRDLKSEWAYETALDIPLPEGSENLPRLHKNMRSVDERINDFNEVDLGYSVEDAKLEAGRCLKCECKLCFNECIMMDEADKAPKQVADDLLRGKADEILSYFCNDCDSCKTVCPKELPIREMYMEARKDIVNANYGQSPFKGHRAVRIHQELGFSPLFTTKAVGGNDNE